MSKGTLTTWTPSSLFPPQHYGSCRETEGVGPESRGRNAEVRLLLKGGRGEGKTSQSFLPVEAMELSGGTEVMVGLVLAGAAVVVTISDSTTLYPVCTDDGNISRESKRKFTLRYYLGSKKPCGIWPLLKDGMRAEQCIFLHWASGFYLDLCCLPECGLEETLQEERELDLFPDSNHQGFVSFEKEPTFIGLVTDQTWNQRGVGNGAGREESESEF